VSAALEEPAHEGEVTKKEEPKAKDEPKNGVGTTSGGSSGSGTSGSIGGGMIATISSAQITSALAQGLGQSTKATIAKLLKQGGLQLSFKALEPGSLVVDWYQLPSGAKLAKTKAKPVLVATGQARSTADGMATVHLKLTAAGKKLLKRASNLKVAAKATFTLTGQAAIVTTKTFSLKGER
jgi:hypothetical protein